MNEQGYLDLVRDVLESGEKKENRTDTPTISKFGCTVKYDISEGRIPLFTTKKVSWVLVVKELLWMISGDTNSKTLSSQGVKIWDANGSRAFLDSVGLVNNEVGELGPVYGHQWRNFNSEGVDQLRDVVEQIKSNPKSRRHVVSAWNPVQISEMALPPCHMMFQFNVSADGGYLDCMMIQRSADLFLGVPFNVASYSILAHMVAKLCGLEAREFVHVMGDAHVYENHQDQCRQQIAREVRESPMLEISGEQKSIDDFEFGDFEVKGYDPHGVIRAEMAV